MRPLSKSAYKAAVEEGKVSWHHIEATMYNDKVSITKREASEIERFALFEAQAAAEARRDDFLLKPAPTTKHPYVNESGHLTWSDKRFYQKPQGVRKAAKLVVANSGPVRYKWEALRKGQKAAQPIKIVIVGKYARRTTEERTTSNEEEMRRIMTQVIRREAYLENRRRHQSKLAFRQSKLYLHSRRKGSFLQAPPMKPQDFGLFECMELPEGADDSGYSSAGEETPATVRYRICHGMSLDTDIQRAH